MSTGRLSREDLVVLAQTAHERHSAGALDEAKSLYQKILNTVPGHFNTLHMMGVALAQQGADADAITFLKRAVGVKPQDADCLNNLGSAQARSGDLAGAADSFTKALDASPGHMSARDNRVRAWRGLGRVEDALSDLQVLADAAPTEPRPLVTAAQVCLEAKLWPDAIGFLDQATALLPDNPNVWFMRAVALRETGALEEAAASLERTIALRPSLPQAHSNLGVVKRALGQIEAALACHDRALALAPDDIDFHINRSGCLLDLERFEDAVESLSIILKSRPDDAMAYFDRASAYFGLKRDEAALADLDKAISLRPDHAGAHTNRGGVLRRMGRSREAIECFRQSLSLEADNPDVLQQLGLAFNDCNDAAAALDCFDRALTLEPDHAESQWGKAVTLLEDQHYRDGWHLYRRRFGARDRQGDYLQTSKPEWVPGTLGRLLVWPEQGVGDEIMFAGLIPDLLDNHEDVTLAADPRLHGLLGRSLPDRLTIASRPHLPDESTYDHHLPMGELARLFRSEPEAFDAARHPYLQADPYRVQQIRETYAPGEKDRLIGISWRTTNPTTGHYRSIPLKQFVAGLPDQATALVSLQYGDVGDEITAVQAECGVALDPVVGVDKWNDIDGLAALIAACDLVISVDNTTVHLAGALGKDVRILLPFLADWRWPRYGAKTPWYPSATLYRQEEDAGWDAVLAQLKSDLETLFATQ